MDANELALGAEIARLALGAPGSADAHPSRARVLYLDGLFAFRQGDGARSLARNDEALAAARANDDVLGQCEAMTGLARLALRAGDYPRVVAISTEAYELARRAGNEAAQSAPLHLLSAGTRLAGDYVAARRWYLESLAMGERLGNPARISQEHRNLGWVELHVGNVDAAAAHLEAAGPVTEAYGEAWTDMEQAGLAFGHGDRETARARLASASKALSDASIVLDPDDQSELDWLTAELAG